MFVPLAAFVLALPVNPPTPTELRTALADENRSVRAKAAVELFRSKGAPVADLIPGLLAARNDPDPAVRAAADAAWAGIGPGVRASLPYVRRSLAAGADPQGAQKAADGFAKSGLEAVPALLDAVADERPNPANGFVSPRSRVAPVGRPVPLLSPGSSRLAEAVIQTFVTVGQPAIPTLAEALTDDSPAVRETAATALGRMATASKPPAPPRINPHPGLADALKPTLPALIDRFDDADPGVRQRAAEAVGQLGATVPGTIPALADALSHRDPAVRRAAVTALKTADPSAGLVKSALTGALDDPEPGVRVASAELLCKLDPPPAVALRTLVAELRTRDNAARAAAVHALESLATKAKPAAAGLRALTHDRDPMARVYAGRALARIGGDDGEAGIAALRGLLLDESASVRVGAAEGLWEVGQFADAVGVLVSAIGSPDGSVSSVANTLIQRTQPSDPQAAAVVQALGEALADATPNARQQVLSTLQRFGPTARPAASAVARLLRAGDENTRQSAVNTLQRLGVTKESVPDLVEGLRSGNDYTRRQVAELLRNLGSDAKEAIPALAKLAKDGPPDARLQAIRVLLRVSPDDLGDVGPVLAALFQSPDRQVRYQAIQLLNEYGTRPPKAVIPALLEAARSNDATLRSMAGSALTRMGGASGPEVRAALKDMLTDKNPEVRLQAANLLEQSGIGEQEAIRAALTELLDAKDATVRMRAAEVVRRQGEAGAKAVLPVLRATLADGLLDKKLWAARLILHPAYPVRGGTALPTAATADDKAAALVVINQVLKDGPSNHRSGALGALSAADPDQLAAVVGGLKAAAADPEANTRLMVADHLAKLGPAERELAGRVYTDLTADRQPFVRSQALTGLRTLGLEAAVADALADQLRDPNTRAQALREIGTLSRLRAKAAVPALKELLSDQNPYTRMTAAETIIRVGDKADVAVAADALVVLAQDENVGVSRPQVATTLQRLGPPWAEKARPLLRQMLASPQSGTRLMAARQLLQERGEDREPITAALRNLLQQGQPYERVQAAELLLQADPKSSADTLRVLKQLLTDSRVNGQAAGVLARLGPEHAVALLPAVRDMLRNTDYSARSQALMVVQQLGPAAAEFAPLVADSLHEPITSHPAANALGAMGEPGVKYLIAALDQSDPARQAAVWGLRTAGPAARAAVPKLVELATNGELQVRSPAVSALIGIGPDAVPEVVRLLDSRSVTTRRQAADVLSKIGAIPQASLSGLEKATADSDVDMRTAVALAAFRAGSRSEPVVRAVAEALRVGDPAARLRAVQTVAGVGPLPQAVAGAVKGLLTDSDGPVRVAVASILLTNRVSADAAAGVLIEAARTPALRLAALTAVVSPGPKPDRLRVLIPELKTLLTDRRPQVSPHLIGRAGVALHAFGDPEAVRLLTAAASDPRFQYAGGSIVEGLRECGPAGAAALRGLSDHTNPSVRLAAVGELGRAAATDPSLVATLVELAVSGDDQVRQQAVNAIGAAGPAAKAAGPTLASLLDDPVTREAAAVAIARTGARERRAEAVEVLRDALTGKNRPYGSAVSSRIIDALGLCGSDAAGVVPELVKLLAGPDHRAHGRVAEALGRIGKPASGATPALVAALKAADPDVRTRAAVALWKIGGKATDVVPVLIDTIQAGGERRVEPQPSVRPAPRQVYVPYSTVLTQLTGPEQVPIRLLAVRTLGEIGPPAKAAVPALTHAEHDPDPAVRTAAADALKRIRSAEPEDRP